jgi:hypothetical protein
MALIGGAKSQGGGGGLTIDKESCSLFLLSEKGDTLSNVVCINECKKNQRYWRTNEFLVHRYFIEVTSPVPWGSDGYWPAEYAFFQYDEKGNISQEPLFWSNYNAEFIDSTGNIKEY